MKKLLTLTFILSLFSLPAVAEAGESESTPLGAEHCSENRKIGDKVTLEAPKGEVVEGVKVDGK